MCLSNIKYNIGDVVEIEKMKGNQLFSAINGKIVGVSVRLFDHNGCCPGNSDDNDVSTVSDQSTAEMNEKVLHVFYDVLFKEDEVNGIVVVGCPEEDIKIFNRGGLN